MECSQVIFFDTSLLNPDHIKQPFHFQSPRWNSFSDGLIHRAHRFVLSEEPANLTARECNGLSGQSCRVDVAAHQNIHLLFGLHLWLLWGRVGGVTWWQLGFGSTRQLMAQYKTTGQPRPLTSWCILWYTFASLSRTTKDWEGAASPLKMKLRSPRWHFMSLKSMRVVSSLNQERGEGLCQDCCVLVFGPKRSLWPGYQQPSFAIFNDRIWLLTGC